MEIVRYHIQYIINIIYTIIEYLSIKIIGVFSLLSFNFFFEISNFKLLSGLLVLIIIDFLTGFYASWANKGVDIKSKEVARTATKITFYFIIISASRIAERAIFFDTLNETIIAFLTITELISILENSAEAGFAVPIKLVDKLKNFKNKNFSKDK